MGRKEDRELDITVQRPFQSVTIKPKGPTQRPRRAVRLNIDRRACGHEYHLLLIPYTASEALAARPVKTKLVAPLLPDEYIEGVDLLARPQLETFPKRGHLQFVRKDRVELAREESPWAG